MIQFDQHSTRQGFLTVSGDEVTFIHDVQAQPGDLLLERFRMVLNSAGMNVYKIDKILEQRASRGDYPEGVVPATFHRVLVSVTAIDPKTIPKW